MYKLKEFNWRYFEQYKYLKIIILSVYLVLIT